MPLPSTLLDDYRYTVVKKSHINIKEQFAIAHNDDSWYTELSRKRMKALIESTRATYMNSLAKAITEVQPMPESAGQIFTLKANYKCPEQKISRKSKFIKTLMDLLQKTKLLLKRDKQF